MMTYRELAQRMLELQRQIVQIENEDGFVGINPTSIQVSSKAFHILFPDGPESMEYYNGKIHAKHSYECTEVVAVFQ